MFDAGRPAREHGRNDEIRRCIFEQNGKYFLVETRNFHYREIPSVRFWLNQAERVNAAIAEFGDID